MVKVIKSNDVDLGDISPDTGFAETKRRSPVVKGEMVAARSDAQAYMDQARTEIERLRQEAELEAEQIKASAYELGLEEGRAAGAAELTEVVARASARMQQIEAQVEPQLRELALTIARKIIGTELSQKPERIVDIVKQALSEKARQRREIFLRVHPEDLQYIRESRAELIEVLSRAKEIGIREDPDVERHGVVIETDAGSIDAQLSTQLDIFEKVLMNVH